MGLHKHTNQKSIFLLLGSILIFSGCAGFRWHKLNEIDNILPPSEDSLKQNASFNIKVISKAFSESDITSSVKSKLKKELIETFEETGYFLSLKEESANWGEKKLHFNLKLKRISNPLAGLPAVVTGYSLYTIPSWAGERWELHAEVISLDDSKHTYDLVDGFTLVQWLPMALAFPFCNPIDAPKAIRVNMYKNLFLKMQEDGIIQKSTVGKKVALNVDVIWRETV